jgi:type IV secretory pathway VirB2 component (pilin)
LPTSLADPSGTSVLAAAVAWVQAALLGTVATVIATLAIAAIGFLMLSGRIPVRRGMSAILGCFILFGASAIAAGIQTAMAGAGGDGPEPAPPPVAAPPPPAPPPVMPPPPPPADPYAGAAVPPR